MIISWTIATVGVSNMSLVDTASFVSEHTIRLCKNAIFIHTGRRWVSMQYEEKNHIKMVTSKRVT